PTCRAFCIALSSLPLRPAPPTPLPYTPLFRSVAFDTIASVDLPAGQYAITATGNIWNTKRDSTPACELLGTSQAGVESRLVFQIDRKSTRLNSSHGSISYAVFCLNKKKLASSS